ncbi:hypothetical protein EV426DRAFT_711528 [Tirmania nivea]|nr:hypothetical protein EV426DRAFT_711528 [Tirmania nivea]
MLAELREGKKGWWERKKVVGAGENRKNVVLDVGSDLDWKASTDSQAVSDEEELNSGLWIDGWREEEMRKRRDRLSKDEWRDVGEFLNEGGPPGQAGILIEILGEDDDEDDVENGEDGKTAVFMRLYTLQEQLEEASNEVEKLEEERRPLETLMGEVSDHIETLEVRSQEDSRFKNLKSEKLRKTEKLKKAEEDKKVLIKEKELEEALASVLDATAEPQEETPVEEKKKKRQRQSKGKEKEKQGAKDSIQIQEGAEVVGGIDNYLDHAKTDLSQWFAGSDLWTFLLAFAASLMPAAVAVLLLPAMRPTADS